MADRLTDAALLERFFASECIFQPRGKVGRLELRAALDAWFIARGAPPLEKTSPVLARALRQRGVVARVVRVQAGPRDGWAGVRLRDASARRPTCPACGGVLPPPSVAAAARTGRLRRGPRKLTPRVRRLLVEALARGESQRSAARAAGVNESTLRDWLAFAEEGHPALARFSKAAASARSLGHQDLARALGKRRQREGELAEAAAELVLAGATLRRTASALGMKWEHFRVLLDRGRRGERHLAALARAAQRRARPSCQRRAA